jgi:hypothetical protein
MPSPMTMREFIGSFWVGFWSIVQWLPLAVTVTVFFGLVAFERVRFITHRLIRYEGITGKASSSPLCATRTEKCVYIA